LCPLDVAPWLDLKQPMWPLAQLDAYNAYRGQFLKPIRFFEPHGRYCKITQFLFKLAKDGHRRSK
jgi:hypothetical protein